MPDFNHPECYYYNKQLFFYIYLHDTKLYIAELQRVKEQDHDRKLLFEQDYITITIDSSIPDSIIKEMNKEFTVKVETNIERRSSFFKQMKAKVNRLRTRYDNNLPGLYHNVFGFTKKENVLFEENTEQLYRSALNDVKTNEEKFPPIVTTIGQLIRKFN